MNANDLIMQGTSLVSFQQPNRPATRGMVELLHALALQTGEKIVITSGYRGRSLQVWMTLGCEERGESREQPLSFDHETGWAVDFYFASDRAGGDYRRQRFEQRRLQVVQFLQSHFRSECVRLQPTAQGRVLHLLVSPRSVPAQEILRLSDEDRRRGYSVINYNESIL